MNKTRSTGTIIWFDNKKGVGCILNESGEEVSVDRQDIQLIEPPKTKLRVTYEEARDSNGLFATYVRSG